MHKHTGIKAFGVSIIIATSATFSPNALAKNSVGSPQEVASMELEKTISKDDARKIVKKYLKSKKKRSQRAGKISQTEDHWKIQILTRENFPVKTVLIDKRTGEISFKKKKRS